MASITRFPITVADPTSRPRLMRSTGVTGYTRRWIANYLTQAAGADVTTWPPAEGATTLTKSLGAYPKAQVQGAEKYVAFNGGDLGVDTVIGKTIALVLRPGAGSQKLATQGNPNLESNTTPSAVFGGPAYFSRPMTASAWHVVIIGLDGVNGTLSVDGNFNSSAAMSVSAIQFYLGRNSGTYGLVDVAEVVAWPTLLDATAHTAINTALRAAHPTLFA